MFRAVLRSFLASWNFLRENLFTTSLSNDIVNRWWIDIVWNRWGIQFLKSVSYFFFLCEREKVLKTCPLIVLSIDCRLMRALVNPAKLLLLLKAVVTLSYCSKLESSLACFSIETASSWNDLINLLVYAMRARQVVRIATHRGRVLPCRLRATRIVWKLLVIVIAVVALMNMVWACSLKCHTIWSTFVLNNLVWGQLLNNSRRI